MTKQHGYDRLVAANPIPDPVRYIEETFDLDLDLDLDQGIDGILARQSALVAVPMARSRLVPVFAAFVGVMALGVVALLLVARTDRAPVGDDPVAVVVAFFDRWNEGDIAGALDLVDPEATVNVGFNSVAELRGLMEYAAQWEAQMAVDCVPADRAGSVSCEWSWTAASAAALGLDGPNRRRFQVSNGRITSLVTPTYGSHESAVSTFAESVDPAGFAKACSPEGAVSVSVYGFAFDAECGRFLASLEQQFLAELESP